MHAQTQTHNPPLPFTREAILGHLQLHASNGPAYVQIQATTALARIMGLFNEAKAAVKDTIHHISDEARALSARVTAIQNGESVATAEEIAEYGNFSNDETESQEEVDEPP